MSSKSLASEVREIYRKGGNVIGFLRGPASDMADTDSIMISYDLQAGTYTKLAESNSEYISQYTAALRSVVSSLGSCESIMAVGVGEATVMNPLMGCEAEDIIDNFGNIKESDVIPYLYPDGRELEQVGVRCIYLNNYIRWDSRSQHEQMIKAYGYETPP